MYKTCYIILLLLDSFLSIYVSCDYNMYDWCVTVTCNIILILTLSLKYKNKWKWKDKIK